MAEGSPVLECVKLTPKWKGALALFFRALEGNEDIRFFSPHPATEEALSKIVSHAGKDLYYLLVEGEDVLGYGLLRGWDEGYDIPSLGIAIHPSARGSGLGKALICFLHALALRRGATQVRLRVQRSNEKAIELYKSLGYIFEGERRQNECQRDGYQKDEYLTGFKTLTGS
jgi:ribosomal protein S18 acetylase RimI-like enzyme